MSLLREWDISEEELSLILNEHPSLRGILLGFVAEYKLTQRWFQHPEITNLRRHSNHDRTSGADFSFTYKSVPITVQVKSLQTHSITFAPESESSPRAFRATFQCDASDRRKVTLPNGEAIETTCLVVGGRSPVSLPERALYSAPMHVSPPNWAALAEQTVAHLRDLIRLDTSNPPGNEAIAAEHIARVLVAHGIDPVVIETAPRRGNVVARLKGDGSAPPLLLYFHTDVVPVEREKWTVDPFGGVVRNGYVYGRGAVDMKGIGAMQLAVFLEIANAVRQGKLTLRRDLILAATADEESDANQGIGVLVDKHPDLLRAEYALSEFGGFTAHINGKRFYPIQAAEKGNVWMRVIAKGQPGHASIPTPENAVVKLAAALAKLAHVRFPTRVTPTAYAYLSTLADHMGGKLGVALRAWLDMEALREVPLQRLLGNSTLAAELHAITHDTVTPTGLRAGYKTNVIPSEAEATLDCRTLPGMSPEGMVESVRRLLGEEHRALEFVIDSSTTAVEFPIDTPLFKLIARALQQHDSAGIPTPYIMSGGTDAKHLARLGVICYGFSPMQLGSNENIFELVHGHDERIPISALAWGVRVLYEVVAGWVSAA